MSDETEEQKKLMRQIDISCVQAFHTMDEIDAMVELAKKYRLAAVFTLPAFSAHVAERLQDTREIHAGGVVSFPGGGDTTGQKKRQAKELWEAGCREIDMVMNLTAFRSHEFSYVKEELLAIREQVPSAIFTESFLSFIGLGVKAPMPSLGSLANAARAGISEYSYKLIFPAMMICLITLACNLLGDGLRDAFDPKLRR